MIAARWRVAIFFWLFCGGGFCGGGFCGGGFGEQLGALGALGFFLGGVVVGDFWSTRSSSEHSDFFEGIFWVVGFFFWGWWGVFWIVSVGKN